MKAYPQAQRSLASAGAKATQLWVAHQEQTGPQNPRTFALSDFARRPGGTHAPNPTRHRSLTTLTPSFLGTLLPLILNTTL